MNIKKGDKILIIKGKDQGKSGKVIKVLPKKSRIVIDGINLIKKNVKPKQQGEKGQMVTIPASVNISNAQSVCKLCGRPARFGYRISGSKKERYCKKCKAAN